MEKKQQDNPQKNITWYAVNKYRWTKDFIKAVLLFQKGSLS